jgi:hypothetical protein
MTRILTSLLAPVVALVLAACTNGELLPHASQVSAKGTSIGVTAGTDPASGGLSANVGYKSASLQINPNTTGNGGKDGTDAEQILSARYGNSEDVRAFMHWDNATAEAADGVTVALGSGVAGGPAAVMVACGLAHAAGGSGGDCTEIFDKGTP